MTLVAFALCVLCQLLLLTGQLLLKRAMDPKPGVQQSWPRMLKMIGLGIAVETVYFFLWLGLLENHPLTRIYPFEGLNPVMMAILAWWLLNEKLSPVAWVGLGLVCVGIGIVSVT